MKLNDIQKEDYINIGNRDFKDRDEFRGKTFLITGATGLIGSNLVNALGFINEEKNLGIRLVLPVRNIQKAKALFSWENVELIEYTLGDELPVDHADYAVHLASPTSSAFFSEKPAQTLLSNIDGTRAVLEWARKFKPDKVVYLSTMEVYGFPEKGHKVTEQDCGAFNSMNARNSYPIAKIACEALCNAYYCQYNVPAVVLRATQTFGPGVAYDDGRVFAQFMRCAVEGKDIVLKSEGLTERSYLYTADAVSAILTALEKGVPGKSYTAANPDTYISIRDMAQMVADKIANGKINVRFDIAENIEKLGYAPTLYMDLDVSGLKALGWNPYTGLQEMFERMINSISLT